MAVGRLRKNCIVIGVDPLEVRRQQYLDTAGKSPTIEVGPKIRTVG
jgi:hypothetical protein